MNPVTLTIACVGLVLVTLGAVMVLTVRYAAQQEDCSEEL